MTSRLASFQRGSPRLICQSIEPGAGCHARKESAKKRKDFEHRIPALKKPRTEGRRAGLGRDSSRESGHTSFVPKQRQLRQKRYSRLKGDQPTRAASA